MTSLLIVLTLLLTGCVWPPVAHTRTFGPLFALLLTTPAWAFIPEPGCHANDWLCKAMVQYCQAIPDPCTPTNIDQPWHPENPQQWLNSIHDPVVAPEQPDAPTP